MECIFGYRVKVKVKSEVKNDWTQFKLEDIGYINATRLPHD